MTQLNLFDDQEKPESHYWYDINGYPKPDVGDMIEIDTPIAKYFEKDGSRYCYGDFAIILEIKQDGQYVVLVVDPFSVNFMDAFLLESIHDISPKRTTMIKWRLVEGGYPFMWDSEFESFVTGNKELSTATSVTTRS